MGIRSLNRFLHHRCKKNLLPCNLEKMRNWKIAIDANNYLYQIINGDLLKNVDEFCKVLKKYNISAIWIFDGPPPDYKKPIIKQRRNYFSSLRNKHHILDQINKQNKERRDTNVEYSMNKIEKKMRKLTSEDIQQVKKYLEENGYTYFVTSDTVEADMMCVELIASNSVNAVLSEDMDIIGMGCPITIRCFDQKNKTCIYYILDDIVADLCITTEKFKKMCSMVSYNCSVEKAFEFIKNQ